MAIAFGSVMNTVTHSGSPASPVVDSFTNTAGSLVIVGVISRTGGDQVTTGSCTYAGAALTLVAKFNTTAASSWAYVFKKTSPATGANNISIAFSGSSDVRVGAVSYTGASDVEANNTGTATATTWTGTVTTVTDNDWVGAWVMNDVTNNAATGPAVLRGAADDPNFLDSNAAQTPAGSKSIGGALSGGGSATFGWITFAITPTSTAINSKFLLFM